MKPAHLFLLPLLFLLSGCFPRTAETSITACPTGGLQAVDFYSGSPKTGEKMTAVQEKDGRQSWDFATGAEDVFLVCHYKDGFERVQRLPNSIRGCSATSGDGAVTRLSCKVWI